MKNFLPGDWAARLSAGAWPLDWWVLESYRRLLKQGDLPRARTVAMAVFGAGKLLFALECGEKKGGGNGWLTGSVAFSAALLGGAVYLPYGRRILKTVPLGMKDVAGVLGASGLIFILERAIASLLQGVEPKDPAARKRELPL